MKEHSRIAVTAIISVIFIFILSISQISAEPYVYYHLDGDGTDAGMNGLDLTVKEDQIIWVEGINGQAVFIKAIDNKPFLLIITPSPKLMPRQKFAQTAVLSEEITYT